MKVIFRCDASSVIGSGHVMRCMTWANALRERGHECSFLCSEETLSTLPFIAQVGYEIMPAHSVVPGVDVLVVDHYGLDAVYESAARDWARFIVVIDDLADRAHDSDVLLDQTLGRLAADYKPLVPAHCSVLTGAGYALLRPQFAELRGAALPARKVRVGEIKHILVSLGSMNLHNITGKILEALAQVEAREIKVSVVLGRQAAHMDAVLGRLEALNAAGVVRAELYHDVQDMAAMMLDADLAIGAGGTTSWERCCLGLPTLLVELADNQKPMAAALARAGAIINLGWHEDISLSDIAGQIAALSADPQLVLKLSEDAFSVCDGLGAQKVCDQIEQLVGGATLSDISLREAALEDAELLLAWRNESATRAASLNNDIIGLDTHMDWLKGVLANDARHLYIAVCGDQALGSIRADFSDGIYELSWSVAPEHRGRGVGRKMLFAVMEKLDGGFYAVIKKDNAASAHIAKAAGMVLEEERDGILHYYKR